jgi:hypothetical protein
MIALLCSVALATSDPLAELIERSKTTKSFTAVYEARLSTTPEPSTVRLDYVAPDRVRLERTADGKSSSMWCVAGVLALQSNEGGAPVHVRRCTRAWTAT